MSDNKKSFLKEYRAIILWFAFAILSFILATALLNKFTYNQFFVKISPFVTIKKLWSILPRVKQKMRVYKPLFSFFGVISKTNNFFNFLDNLAKFKLKEELEIIKL